MIHDYIFNSIIIFTLLKIFNTNFKCFFHYNLVFSLVKRSFLPKNI